MTSFYQSAAKARSSLTRGLVSRILGPGPFLAEVLVLGLCFCGLAVPAASPSAPATSRAGVPVFSSVPRSSSGNPAPPATDTNYSSPTDAPSEPANPTAPINRMEALDDKHRLAIGDHLSFRIVEDEEDPKESRDPKPMTVTDAGDLEVPYIGRFPAENKTCKQLAGEIKTALEKDYYRQATVIISIDLMTKSRGRVYLVGPVHIPGPQEIPSDEVFTLSKAILRAGGFTDYADKQRVQVTRKGGSGEKDKKTFVVDVGQIFDKGKTERDLPLEPGDLILIPERLIHF